MDMSSSSKSSAPSYSSYNESDAAAINSPLGSTTPSNATSSKPSKPPYNVIYPAPLFDTLALLVLFLQFPTAAMVLVHGLFIASSSPRAALNHNGRSLWASVSHLVLNSVTSFSSPSTSSSSSRSPSSSGSFLKTFLIDVCLALTTLYLTPLFKNLVMVFAHALVASSFSGGSFPFQNAIYSTTVVEIARISWHYFSSRYLYLPPLAQHDGHRHIHHNYESSYDTSYSFLDGPQQKSYNTVTSTWALIPSLFRFIWHTDWRHEFPLLVCQIFAVHVIGLKLLPFVRKVFFPDKSSNISSSDNNNNNNNISSATDFGGINTGDPTDFDSYSVNTESSTDGGLTDPTMEGSQNRHMTTISVPDSNHSGSSDAQSSTADLNFLYAPSSKKNKRLAQVRANQPLWSTLASSIVLAARQESSNIFVEEVVDGGNAHLDGLSSNLSTGHCYVRYIFENVIAFEMVGFSSRDPSSFLVRVNGIQWPQVSVQPSLSDITATASVTASTENADVNNDDDGSPFLIIVYGLTPTTQYEIEIGHVIASAAPKTLTVLRSNVSTTARNSNNTPSTLANGGGSLAPVRPLSPVTTLLDTLTTTQMTLSEEKQRMKRTKKEHNKRINTLRAEIESLKVKSEANDKGDERTRRKVLSLRESVRQFEDEIESIQQGIAELEAHEAESNQEFAMLEVKWKECMEALGARGDSEHQTKREWSLKVGNLESEISNLLSRRDKLQAKKDRLNAEAEKVDADIDTAIKASLERRDASRQKKLQRRKNLEDEFSSAIQKMADSVEETKRKTNNIWVNLQMQASSVAATNISNAPTPATVTAISFAGAAAVPRQVSPEVSPSISGTTLSSPGAVDNYILPKVN